MSSKNWKLLRRTILYQPQTQDEISFISDQIKLPSGREFDYVYLDSPYEVAYIIGFKDDKVLLINQHRYLINKVLIEIPAGSPEGEETIEQGAKREFLEETGYQAATLIKVTEFYPTIGITNQLSHLFIALDIFESNNNLEETEDIKAEWVQLSDAVKFVLEGKVKHAGAAYAILFLDKWLEKNKI